MKAKQIITTKPYVNILQGFAGHMDYSTAEEKLSYAGFSSDKIGGCFIFIIHDKSKLCLIHADIGTTNKFINYHKHRFINDHKSTFIGHNERIANSEVQLVLIRHRERADEFNALLASLEESVKSCHKIIDLDEKDDTVLAWLSEGKLFYQSDTIRNRHNAAFVHHPHALALHARHMFNINIGIICGNMQAEKIQPPFFYDQDQVLHTQAQVIANTVKNYVPSNPNHLVLFQNNQFTEAKTLAFLQEAKEIHQVINFQKNDSFFNLVGIVNKFFESKFKSLGLRIRNLSNQDYNGTPFTIALVWYCFATDKSYLIEQLASSRIEGSDQLREIIQQVQFYSGQKKVSIIPKLLLALFILFCVGKLAPSSAFPLLLIGLIAGIGGGKAIKIYQGMSQPKNNSDQKKLDKPIPKKDLLQTQTPSMTSFRP